MRLDKYLGRSVSCYYYYGLSIALLLIILSLLQSAECYTSQPSQKVTSHRRYSDKQSSYLQNPLCDSGKCKSTSNSISKLKSSKTNYANKPVTGASSVSRNNSSLTIHDIHELKDLMKKKKKKCKAVNYKGFECQKVKWYIWLVNEFDNNVTAVTSWIELLRNEDLSDLPVNQSELVGNLPETWYDKLLHKLVTKWGGPIDKFMFQKYKEYVTSRELKLKVPIIGEFKVSPRVHAVAATGRSTARWFFDPGFNLKLKLPFFKDELKVAISTGPSFLAGIGTGIALLILKSIFAPFLFGLKYMIYNFFWKEGSPWDMMKSIWGYGGGGGWGPEPWESNAPPPAVEHYEPPHVHNHYDNGKEQYGATGGSGFGFGYNGGGGGGGFDQKLQFSQLNPILQGLTGPSSNSYKSSSIEEGRHRQHFKGLLTGPSDDSGYGITGGGSIVSESQDHHDVNKESGFNYVPSNGLQAEVENYDPFYSPLLSRIDSIFTHLGYHDEGCRERAVCSIYKFPVKYAPYSNLLSAQLSKHQSELKRPVTSSPKVLRYFKYMKAAKDGQGAANCIEMYPKCTNDTDSVSNLPMITTFNQLTELMGPEVSGPSG